jgi:RNA polymerase sigma-70 factor (ECF subfamily)
MNRPLAPLDLDRLFAELRPKLHRYCARMTGSAIDGEDVVQTALVKAVEALSHAAPIDRPEAWLFKIAHNAALDFLRGRARRDSVFAEADPAELDDPADPLEDRQSVAASLHTLMRLPAAQRSAVVLMDVLGFSLQEIASILETTVPAVKAALHRGRARLRRLAETALDFQFPALSPADQALLVAYVDRFNARDFDAVRDMLAEEVRLELVAKSELKGRSEVGRYFSRYDSLPNWRLVAGAVEGQPAVLVHAADAPAEGPGYFVLLQWADGRLIGIRDFYYARYAAESAGSVQPV